MAMAAPPCSFFFPYAVHQTFSLWSLYSDGPLRSRPQTLGSCGDALPAKTRGRTLDYPFNFCPPRSVAGWL